MYSTYNEGKSVVAERFIRTLKNKLYKHMTATGKKVYSRHPLIRTRKGLDVLFELTNVRIIESSGKTENLDKRSQMSVLSSIFYNFLKKSLIIVCIFHLSKVLVDYATHVVSIGLNHFPIICK